jgi:uncharacterized protein (TIGR00725 family)
MGSADARLGSNPQLVSLAEKLGAAIASRDCILITGGTTGLPDMVSRAARRRGALTVGISPAADRREHRERYNLPTDASDVIIYTGFGLKGRNVINIRSSDIVIIFGGGMGTLNEFTIAYDEGKVIGVLEGSGGIADHIKDILGFGGRAATRIFFDRDPEPLLDACLRALGDPG